MFSRSCIDDIRWIESSLYQGPETAEKVFELDESYQGPHENRRAVAKSNGNHGVGVIIKKTWYELTYDPQTKKVIRTFFDREEK